MGCKTCGGTMVGDGYTLVRHCETVDVSGNCYEPDAGPIYCTTSDHPESTEHNRVWHSGPPPHVGWWNASVFRDVDCWRWWDGLRWSRRLGSFHGAKMAERTAGEPAKVEHIEWNDYWPAGARVPRLTPEDFEIGARWTVISTQFEGEFVGMEMRVKRVTDYTITWENEQFLTSSGLSLLPNGHYMPSRCVGPQTRWDFPMPKNAPDHMALLFEAYNFGQFADDFNRPLPLTVRAALRKHLEDQLAGRCETKECRHG